VSLCVCVSKKTDLKAGLGSYHFSEDRNEIRPFKKGCLK